MAPQTAKVQQPDDSFLLGANETFIAELYSRYLREPGSVDPEWAGYFAGLSDAESAVLADLRGATWSPRTTRVIGANGAAQPAPAAVPAAGAGLAARPEETERTRAAIVDSIRALMMIRNYRVRGHLNADLDPLRLEERQTHTELTPESYGFTAADYDRPIFLHNVLGFESATLRQIMDKLHATYCRTIGVEFMHIQDPDQKSWIQNRIESNQGHPSYAPGQKRRIYSQLTAAETFERFLDRKFTGTKRFGLDGSESMIPALEAILSRAAVLGIEEVVLGMPHRGRLNVLANFMGKPFAAIFSEFQGGTAYPENVQGSGDVKYHLGTSSDRDVGGKIVHMSLTANPSHLEAVNPVALGKVRAKQTRRTLQNGGQDSRDKVMCILLHGDAAFSGQGLVAETFDLSELKGYRTGGTIHFIVNNQIGFTTSPTYSRSSPYCSDLAKGVQAPILHVNGDDPEAVAFVAEMAMDFRQRFKKDVVVDMFCYRRFGHNESDEPAFTQPLMYRKIGAHPTAREIYAKRLVAEGVLTQEEADSIVSDFHKTLEDALASAKAYRPNKADWLEGSWSGLEASRGEPQRGKTPVAEETLRAVGAKLTEVPRSFNIHPKIARQLEAKREAIAAGKGIDWATAEALAIGTLLVEGTPVRLSGQDSGRGTFSQRHAVLIDQQTEDRFIPLNNLAKGQALFEVIDSPLSEAAVLGFEYGYSLAEPHALVMWEGQFGDFANGAQVIIDQFIVSGETKWLRMSGLVMLLPHGYEGQGPEHSSARLERYLQLCAQDNIQVANCSTPASYFHILRRQVRRPFRKPLILMTPKSLLRHRLAVSELKDMGAESNFHRLQLEKRTTPDENVKRVVLCTGKVYYDLAEERARRNVDVPIIRLEQLYPFPARPLLVEFAKYKGADIVWCQEEPQNMGAWTFVAPKIHDVMRRLDPGAKEPRYAGRADAASPATGFHSRHVEEQKKLVDEALSL